MQQCPVDNQAASFAFSLIFTLLSGVSVEAVCLDTDAATEYHKVGIPSICHLQSVTCIWELVDRINSNAKFGNSANREYSMVV